MKRVSLRGLRLGAAVSVAAILSVSLTAGNALAQMGDETFLEAESLSPEAKQERAEALISSMRAVLKSSLERRQYAQEKQDIIQINCVNDRLQSVKGLLKIAEQSEISLRESNLRGDTELANHEFTKISMASARVENFRVEVEGCIGEASQYTGRTTVNLEVDTEIREDDPTDADEPILVEPIDTARPVALSGNQ